eukprot:s990_g13.t1
MERERAAYSSKRPEAADALLKERTDTHFSALNDLVKLATRPDVGNIVLVMPWLRSCKTLVEMVNMKKRREESLANPRPQNDPSWEKMEELMVSVIVDGWDMYVKEKRPKGQRLENEVDPEKASLHMIPIAPTESAEETGSVASWAMVESIPADLPKEPEHIEVHETAEQDVDDELSDAMLQPYIEKLPRISDEPDQEEDVVIVFRDPIVGGLAAHLPARGKATPYSASKFHAVEFRLDGSGIVNIITTDVTRDPSKLEMRFVSTQETADGPRIIRRCDFNDEEKNCQVERELYLEELAPEGTFRAGDLAASITIVIGDTIGQFIKLKTQDQATMASYKLAPAYDKNWNSDLAYVVPEAESASDSEECCRAPTGPSSSLGGSRRTCQSNVAKGNDFPASSTKEDIGGSDLIQ